MIRVLCFVELYCISGLVLLWFLVMIVVVGMFFCISVLWMVCVWCCERLRL